MKTSYYLPTYAECRKICDANDNFIFYETKHKIDGYDISVFNYRLAQSKNFYNPVEGLEGLTAHELRGLTFVFNTDGTLYKRYLMLEKFWNLDQTPCSMYSEVKDLAIKSVYNKEDGSIASFIMLPNGRVIAKSKAYFTSELVEDIQAVYDKDNNIREFVDYCLATDIVPIFEFVSPKNKIVLNYDTTQLILLCMRNNTTGEYLDLSAYSDVIAGIKTPEISNYTLDELIGLKPIATGIEGFVVDFENDKKIKIKTDWYFAMHNLLTEQLEHENDIIRMVIEDTIDDVLSQIDDVQKKTEIGEITDAIGRYIVKISDAVDELLVNYKTGDVKTFALTYNKLELFPIAIGIINGRDRVKLIQSKILKETRHLMEARKWLKENGKVL